MIGRPIAFLGIAVLCAVGAAVILEAERAGRLRTEGDRLEPICAECARLGKENERWQKAITDAGDLDSLRGRSVENEHLRASINAFELKQRNLKRALGISDEAVWPAWAQVVPSGEWKFRGQASPMSAMESVLWTARAGDVDRLAALIGFEPNAKQKADEIFAGLPGTARVQYASPESIVATLMAEEMPTNYSAMAEVNRADADPDTAVLTVRVEDASGAQRDLNLKFQLEGNAWHLNVPEAVVSRYEHQLLTAPPTK